MKTKYFFLAAIAGMTLVSCSNDEYIGDNSPTLGENDGSIQFTYSMPNATRADIYGKAAADILGNHFYVIGTKGTEATTYPSSTLVFDNYLVHYGVNTAGTTASNTANWEYVGVKPGVSPYENYVFLSSMTPAREVDFQTIKYWDYSTDQYHFYAFSTGTYDAVATSSTAATNIGVTKMAYGSGLENGATAYTFDLPNVNALKQAYITDIVEVEKANYGKEVQLQFKSLGAKVRVGLYETVPGYSVKDVNFYTVDGTDYSGAKGTTAALISANTYGIPQKGQIKVSFPHVGTKYQKTPVEGAEPKADYNKASATIVLPPTEVAENYKKAPTFGALTAQLVARENKEVKWQADPAGWVAEGSVFLGRTLTTATFAGDKNADFYEAIFPVDSPSPLTLRVDYTLVPTDGAGETIIVKGAKAVVPSTYTKWLPNYAYTYIFKISDNTNGWTGTTSDAKGLFPITFDAVVTEATDATGEQKTITTVSAPTITTYQQNHDITKNEYSKATAKDIYVQVMDNSDVPATLKGDLNGTTKDDTKRSLLYAVTGVADPTEALVMDALENQSSVSGAGVITGRNGVILTPATIDATVATIENGADDNPISITAGQAAKIAYTLDAANYAYVYDYTASDHNKVYTTFYQPISVTVGTTLIEGKRFVANSTLTSWDDKSTADHYSTSGAPDPDYVYFSITTNGGASKTYSFVSVDGKDTLPAGLLKYPVSSLGTGAAEATAAENTVYFTTYIKNDGAYAVKVIKLVSGS